MRPIGPDDPSFKHYGLEKAFTYTPAAGPLAGWKIEGSYDLVDARLTITELRVSAQVADVPENGITGSLLRQISPAALTDTIRGREQGWLAFLEDLRSSEDDDSLDPSYVRTRKRLTEHAQDVATAPRSGPTSVKGRPPLEAGFLRDVARDHMEDVGIDGKYGSIKRLADRRGISPNTAKDWIKKAKERGLYPLEAHDREE
jgi:hypothetical protein